MNVRIAIVGLLLVLLAPAAASAALSRLDSPLRLSGIYAFHGSLADRAGRRLTVMGSLSFDWLGDISGEADATPAVSASRAAPRCHFLIDGSYRRTPRPGVVDGAVRFTPAYGACDGALKPDLLHQITITPGRRPDFIELASGARSGGRLVGQAFRESSP